MQRPYLTDIYANESNLKSFGLLDYGRVDISLNYRKSKHNSRSSGSSMVTHSMDGVTEMGEDTLGIIA
jgi:hypothetical protein